MSLKLEGIGIGVGVGIGSIGNEWDEIRYDSKERGLELGSTFLVSGRMMRNTVLEKDDGRRGSRDGIRLVLVVGLDEHEYDRWVILHQTRMT